MRTPSHGPITACTVVVPARDEEDLLPRCLRSLTGAIDRLATEMPTVTARVVVVLDRCHDDSAAVVADFPNVHALDCDAGNVGVARHVGCRWAIAEAVAPAGASWLACTDADSAVPPDWLTTHLRLAAGGADVVLGTVIPDSDDLTGTPFDRWLDSYPQEEDHSFIHGANLGVRADVYLRAGGFRAASEHEDVHLVASARRLGATIAATADCAVLTSGRHVGRTPSGFAGWMSDRDVDPRAGGGR